MNPHVPIPATAFIPPPGAVSGFNRMLVEVRGLYKNRIETASGLTLEVPIMENPDKKVTNGTVVALPAGLITWGAIDVEGKGDARLTYTHSGFRPEDIAPGDEIRFTHNAIQPNKRLPTTGLYPVDVDRIIAYRKPGGTWQACFGHVIVEPCYERGAYRLASGGVWTSRGLLTLPASPVRNVGAVVSVCQPVHGIDLGLQAGDSVAFKQAVYGYPLPDLIPGRPLMSVFYHRIAGSFPAAESPYVPASSLETIEQ